MLSMMAVLRLPSRSRKSKDGGSDAKRARAQTYDTPVGKGGQHSSSQASPSSPPGDDERSTNSLSSTGCSDSRLSLREAGPTQSPPLDPRELERRQVEEKEFIRQHDSSEAHIWYLVDVKWIQAWKHFVTRGSELPGPIDNSRLVDRVTGEPKRGLHAVDDYRGVNEEIWKFWQNMYGGGPVIRRAQLDLYAPRIEDPSDHQRQKDLHLPGSAAHHGSSSSRAAGSSTAQRRAPGSSGGEVNRDRDEASDNSSGARSSTTTPTPPPLARVQRPPPEKNTGASQSSSRRMFSLGGRSGSSTKSPKQQDAKAATTPASSPTQGVRLCCDKCDGPHETDKCPHFKKAREKHKDAWTAYGKSKKGTDADGDGAPIIESGKANVVRQPGDGSCLFHSLSYGLNEGSSAITLRREICGYIARNPDMKIADTPIEEWVRYDSNDSVREYAERMAEGNLWGGGIEMAALTKMKGVNVHVYERCREGYRRISAFESPNARKTVSVIYQGRNHYDAIVI